MGLPVLWQRQYLHTKYERYIPMNKEFLKPERQCFEHLAFGFQHCEQNELNAEY